MKILLIGGGGREHAIGWKLAESSSVSELASAPGNPGLARLGPTFEDLDITEPNSVAAVAAAYDLVVIGPEAPLAAGAADALHAASIPVFGPTRAAARLESSKAFAKQLMARAGVATARPAVFHDLPAALTHLEQSDGPYVVKADGLAAGKGVLVTDSRADAMAWARACFEGRFGSAGATIVIEEYLEGREVSVFALADSSTLVPFEPARDYKRLADRDQGPNTGGMGAYSPVPDLEPGLIEHAVDEVMRPVLALMEEDGVPYRGFLYAGLILTAAGPKVLEFNCRLGDPETQVVLPRLQTDLALLLVSGAEGALDPAPLRWADDAAVNVVLASPGYPEAAHTGLPITGVKHAEEASGVALFHAGTSSRDGTLTTSGGRVLNVVGTGPDLASARERAYEAVGMIDFPGMQFRTDIAGGPQ